MNVFLTVVRKLMSEARATLVVNLASMFLLGWLNTYFTARVFHRVRKEFGEGGGGRMLRQLGGDDMSFSTASLEVAFWIHPFLWVPVVTWAIGRASLAVAGEVERGTLDMVLTRPISRTSYLLAQVTAGLVGLALIVGFLIAGNQVALFYNRVEDPPGVRTLFWPALNLMMLGVAVMGLTLGASALDRVRWRSLLFGSFVTVGGYVAWFLSTRPEMEGSPWTWWMERVALFSLFNPVDAVGAGKDLAFNLEMLAAVGGAGLVVAFAVFPFRDLPANS
ncbi:MAG TPA: ABC transporter permease subunit [Isosphaeraceae bacterium]|nr:ABC transporter permease subunit [Isosphaeraceae bacterium]